MAPNEPCPECGFELEVMHCPECAEESWSLGSGVICQYCDDVHVWTHCPACDWDERENGRG